MSVVAPRRHVGSCHLSTIAGGCRHVGEREKSGDYRNFCVKPVIRHEFTNRSLNMTANCVFAWAHSRGGRFHSAAAWFKTKYNSFVAASSEGKCPLVLMARRSFELS